MLASVMKDLSEIADPGTAAITLLQHAEANPIQVLEHPQLALISIDDPNMWLNIRGRALRAIGYRNMLRVNNHLDHPLRFRYCLEMIEELLVRRDALLAEDRARIDEMPPAWFETWFSLFGKDLFVALTFYVDFVKGKSAGPHEINTANEALHNFLDKRKCSLKAPPLSFVCTAYLIFSLKLLSQPDEGTAEWWEHLGWAATITSDFGVECAGVDLTCGASRGRYWHEKALKYSCPRIEQQFIPIPLYYPDASKYF